jgi:dolichol-phosphate mannosyltransferase
VGSRHCPGGGIEQWPLRRRVVSFGASALARPLTACTDPMAGFFALRPEVIRGVKLNAAGFKILLEVLVKGNYTSLHEEPITFRDRVSGESKLTRGVIVSYLMHLARLYLYPGSAPLLQFLFVGATGAILDIGLFSALHKMAVNQVIAQSVSFFSAVVWNFNWNKRWTFARQQQRGGGNATKQFVKFVVTSLIAYTLRTALFTFLTHSTGINTTPGVQAILLFVITMVTVVNFLGSKLWAFA